MTGSQSSLVTDMVPVMSKITDHKLNDDHLKDDPPTGDTKTAWLRDDARLFLQIRNSIYNEVIGLVNHCEFVKELMDYLEFLYFAFYRVEKKDQPFINYFMEFKKTYNELNILLPFSSDVKVQQRQREKMTVMSFIAGLSSDFDSENAQILPSSDVLSLQDVFSRILRTENPPASITPMTNRGASHKFETPTTRSVVECNYCHKPSHMKFECRKLKFRNQQENQRNQQQYRNQSSGQKHLAHVMSANDDSDKSNLVSADDYAKFSQYQESLKSASPSITTIVDSGKPDICLLSPSSKWVIDSGATDYISEDYW
ncbi:hypothetical protein RND81_08G048400 [Saponaria officinalis]|uniref:Uncharacterized protein n=1 Tax=Saponaria officinalis TaxID=3572 RepID=A0AAW1J3M6_SAPOF